MKSESKRLVYWWNGASIAGETRHPQTVVEGLGCKILKYEAFGISDCSLMEVDIIPENLPPYVELATKGRFTGEE